MLSAGGWLCCNAPRSKSICDYAGIIDALRSWCGEHADGAPLLRIYWYDGARNQVPTDDHDAIGALKDVKTRLGRLVAGSQKGVDSRIVRDLILLSRERAMSTAYLISGDEDLREGVAEAQAVGVRVVLLGLPRNQRSRQSYSLIAEADEHIVLPEDFWSDFFKVLADDDGPADQPSLPEPETPYDDDELDLAAAEFAEQWMGDAKAKDLKELDDSHPRLPNPVDVELLKSVSNRVGHPLRNDDVARIKIRATFRKTVRRLRDETEAGQDEN